MGRAGGHRIVSLVPSITETLSAWGVEPIACTRFCERPDLPSVGGTKDPDLAAIAALVPDLVVLDAEENRREDYDALVALGLEVHATHVRSIEDVASELQILAARVGATWSPGAMPERLPARARVFVPIWRRPWMALGRPTYGASLLEHLGVATIFADRGPYAEVTLDEAVQLRADAVLAPSEPYPFTARQLPELERVAPTTFVDGKDLFWWGVRTRAALVRLKDELGSL
jgi:ABC-type Fe3+-hydroxamate transport system substrate-binding protein